ncbi:MAG: DHH family phosphoesterase [Methanomicrobiales archaeon]|nr:DHH family phosphoesterase [Methanomicrobiales archaeon]
METGTGVDAEVATAAEIIRRQQEVTVISHIDADGISSEAILSQAIAREGIAVKSVFVRQLEPLTMHQVPKDRTFKIFTDLGAGQQNLLQERGLDPEDVLIIDHHVSQPCETPYVQVNCIPHGLLKLSAAGLAYLVARRLDPDNCDLAKIAVIGNVGDMMAREHCGLTGPARGIVEDGVTHGSIVVRPHDLNCYGTSTRALHVCLAYNDDPFISGISNDVNGARRFLKKIGIQGDDGRRDLIWEGLPFPERKKIMCALVEQLMANGEPFERLFCETYLFPGEREGEPLRNAQEFATVLNACGRWARPDIGGAICRGDRSIAYRDAKKMLANHRAVIRELLQFILDTGVAELTHLQYIHVGNRFPDTIVGIGAGMALSKLNWQKPILILCELPEDATLVKASMRTTERIVARGVDLQAAASTVSAEFGGSGGGHKIAAGAYIPRGSEERFVNRVNELLGEQLGPASAGHR